MPRRRTFMDCWERVRSTGVLGKRSKHADQTDVLTEAMYDALAARIKEQTGQGVDHNEASLSSVRSYLEDTEAELSQIKAKFYPKPETTIPDQTKPPPPSAAAKVGTTGAAPSGKFMLKTFEGRADAEIEGESGTLTVRASTAENADGTHSVNTLMVFVPPGILDPRSAPRQEVKLTQPVTGKTKEEARFKAFEAFTETLNAGEFTPAAAAKPETPAAAVAEVKEHLQKVAKDAPSPAAAQRSQKDIKTELVQRLEAAIEKAPSERDLADLGEGKRDPTEGEMVSKRTQQSRMTIEIPGDGTFTVWNTKESLGEVLQRAKRISTATKYKGFTERPIKSLSEAELKEMRVEPPSTPSGLPDEGDGSNVLREYATENLSGQEQSANPSGGNTDNQGKFSKPGSGVTIKPSSLLPENTRSVRTNTARVKAGDLIKLNDGWYEVEGYTPDPVYIDTGILRVRERGNPSKWAELKKDPGENITVQRPTERREQSRATPSDNPPLTPRVIREHLRRKWGLTTDSSVVLVNNPDAPVDAEVIFQDGELVRIEINAPAIASTAQLDEAVEHELSHAASDNLDLESLFSQLPATQQTQIEADMDRLGYQPGELSNERNARQLHALAKAWRGRSWFTKLTGEILRLAHKVGFRITRLAAESMSARRIADALRLAQQPVRERLLGLKEGVESSEQSRRVIGRGALNYGMETIPAKTEKETLLKAQAIVARHGDDFQSAWDEVRNLRDSYLQSVTHAALMAKVGTAYAKPGADPILASLMQRMGEPYGMKESDVGQNLQAFKQANRIILPFAGLYSFMRVMRQRVDGVLGAKFGPQTGDDIARWITEAGDQAWEAMAHALKTDRATLQSIMDLAKEAHGQGLLTEITSITESMADKIMAMFPQAGYRAHYTPQRAKQLAADFFKLMAGDRPAEGNVHTFNKIVGAELGTILKEAMKKKGFNPGTGTRLTTAEKIARFLSVDPLKGDKLALIDELVRNDIATRSEEAQQQLSELWDSIIGTMSTAPTSDTTARRIVQEQLKVLAVNWKEVFTSGQQDAVRKQIVEAVANEVQGAATSKLDLSEFNEQVGRVFDEIAAVRHNRHTLASLISSPENQAETLISQFAKIQSDTPSFTPAQKNLVLELFREHLKTPLAEDVFLDRLETIGVSSGSAQKLFKIAGRELAARRMVQRMREQERLTSWMKNNNAVMSLLNKVAKQEDIDWRELFTGLPEAAEARRKALLEKIQADERFASLDTAVRAELARVLSKAWEQQRNRIVHQEFGKKVALPRIDREDAVKVEKILGKLIEQHNLGLLDQPAFLNAIAPEYGLESLDGPTAKKLAQLGVRANEASEGLPKFRILKEIERTLTDVRGINPWDLAKDYWYASVLFRLGTFANVTVGSGTTMPMFVGGAIMDRLARADAKGSLRIIQQMLSGLIESAQVAQHIIRTGDDTVLPDFHVRAEKMMKGETRENSLEALRRRGGMAGNTLGMMVVTRRVMTGLDYLFATAARDALIVYSALTRGDPAIARKWNQESTRLARAQAKGELGPTASRAEIIIQTRHILERELSEEVKDIATHFGRRVAQNSELTGLSRMIYDVVAKIPFWIKAPGGLAFLKSALNMATNAAEMFPGAGAAKALTSTIAEHQIARHGTDAKGWARFTASPEERRIQIALQSAGLATTFALAGLLFDDDDKNRTFDLSGNWKGLTPQQKKDLLDKGEKPLAVKLGQHWIPYRNTPLIATLSTLGYLRDLQRFHPDKFKAAKLPELLLAVWINGMLSIKDISSISGLTSIPNWGASSTDDPQGILGNANRFAAQSIGRFTAGFVPSMIKEIDEIADPHIYQQQNKDKYLGYWLRNLPFIRRTIGEPAINLFGEPIRQIPSPLRAYLSSEESNDPAWLALNHALNLGVFPTFVSPTTQITANGIKREMSPDEHYRNKIAFGQQLKKIMTKKSKDIQAMNREQLLQFFKDNSQWRKLKAQSASSISK